MGNRIGTICSARWRRWTQPSEWQRIAGACRVSRFLPTGGDRASIWAGFLAAAS
jgi:hypothetical protein